MKDMKRYGLLREFNAINKFFEKSPSNKCSVTSTVESILEQSRPNESEYSEVVFPY